ncbi:hypothetical protein [Nocardioides insulae]|uniref:hypothetical protein n=1 Tax=Nocardioides insulae TaxID=394734 RepID=UPI000A04BD76|nr:hypothetical protein [Nocardioides insulae]
MIADIHFQPKYVVAFQSKYVVAAIEAGCAAVRVVRLPGDAGQVEVRAYNSSFDDFDESEALLKQAQFRFHGGTAKYWWRLVPRQAHVMARHGSGLHGRNTPASGSRLGETVDATSNFTSLVDDRAWSPVLTGWRATSLQSSAIVVAESCEGAVWARLESQWPAAACRRVRRPKRQHRRSAAIFSQRPQRVANSRAYAQRHVSLPDDAPRRVRRPVRAGGGRPGLTHADSSHQQVR